ncbi:MAG: LysM peptidoglycan-binding domain-containing protein [Gammaproteobacteria bacterium]|nr:LysM peptidoglycan-binding domain-containing protein [Gammaproteobacteria bacterium]
MSCQKRLLGAVFALLMLGQVGAQAEVLTLKPGHPQQYVVVKGDTLWDISTTFLNSPWLWPEIWQVNPEIKNPHLIYPGDTIYLVYIDGRPVLKVKRGLRVVKLTPQVRSSKVRNGIPTLPLDIIRQFISRPYVVTPEELDRLPYVVAAEEGRLISGTDHNIYVRGIDPALRTKRYAIIHIGDAYRNPGAKSDDILGIEAIKIANAEVVQFGDTAKLHVTQASREILAGDRLQPIAHEPGDFDANFPPHAPLEEVEGLIIDVLDGISRTGRYQTVVLNMGTADGMEPGHVLGIFQSGDTVRDPYASKPNQTATLPEEKVGELVVFRPFEKVSFALIMESYRDIKLYDTVKNP